MTRHQPATAHSNSIERPDCSRCGTAMLLFGIEAESPGRCSLSSAPGVKTLKPGPAKASSHVSFSTNALSGTIPLAIAFRLQPELPEPSDTQMS